MRHACRLFLRQFEGKKKFVKKKPEGAGEARGHAVDLIGEIALTLLHTCAFFVESRALIVLELLPEFCDLRVDHVALHRLLSLVLLFLHVHLLAHTHARVVASSGVCMFWRQSPTTCMVWRQSTHTSVAATRAAAGFEATDARTSVHPHTHTRTLAHITLTHAHTQLGIGNRAEDMGLVTQSYVRHDSVTCEK